MNSEGVRTRVIEARPGWQAINIWQLWAYRDLFRFLVLRDIKARYAQSVLGVGWAVIEPVFFMVIFTLVFGRLVQVSSDGAPYAIFSYTAVVPWTFFAAAVTGSTGSLIANSALLTKVYFPRLVMPLAASLGKVVNFVIGLIVLVGLLLWYGITPTLWTLFLPYLIVIMVLAASGVGMWLSALAVQYRDIRQALTIGIQLAMYVSPVIYPVSLIPEKYHLIYAINPMVGIIEGFRAALLNTNPMPWDLIVVGTVSTLLTLVGGAFYFRRMERRFADVV